MEVNWDQKRSKKNKCLGKEMRSYRVRPTARTPRTEIVLSYDAVR